MIAANATVYFEQPSRYTRTKAPTHARLEGLHQILASEARKSIDKRGTGVQKNYCCPISLSKYFYRPPPLKKDTFQSLNIYFLLKRDSWPILGLKEEEEEGIRMNPMDLRMFIHG